jgi:hypothetical protein
MTYSTPDIVLRAVGTALAGASMAFAGFMLAFGGDEVRVFGIEHLEIFARPHGAPRDGLPPVRGAVDMSSTGSVADLSPSSAPQLRPGIVAARGGHAWLRVDGKILPVSPGQIVAGLGQIAAIVHRDGGWAVLDEKGATLLALPDSANGAGLFSRRLMFE